MASIVDERGFNQGFKLSRAQKVRLRRRAKAIAAEMEARPTQGENNTIRVLELGCGTGELAFELVDLINAEITGVDLSSAFIAKARETYQHPRLKFSVADLNEAPADAELDTYDYIVGNGILHHLYDQLDEFLPKLKGWLKPGGKLVFWEPNLFNPYVLAIFSVPILRRLTRLEPAEMAFSPQFIRRKLDRSGFADIHATPRDFLIPPTPAPLINTVISAGGQLERWPVVRFFAQSIFLTATKAN